VPKPVDFGFNMSGFRVRFRVTITVRESMPICIARECTYLLVLISIVAILGKKIASIDTDTFIYSVLRPGAPERLEAGSITDDVKLGREFDRAMLDKRRLFNNVEVQITMSRNLFSAIAP